MRVRVKGLQKLWRDRTVVKDPAPTHPRAGTGGLLKHKKYDFGQKTLEDYLFG